ncbi:APH-domain-containing protein [Diaporthe eres]|nr:APH-domain-containing protein [Diaporthe eres]
MSSGTGSMPGLSHGLDNGALGHYLAKSGKIPNLQLPVVTTKIGYGQSNPTYFVDDATGARFILRKKPPGPAISPVAHRIDREYRVLKELGSVKGFPVPKVFDLCEDASIIGTPFYVMEFVKGRIITDVDLGELSPGDRRKTWFSAIETLAWLHTLDPDRIGLSDYGKRNGFYARHCSTWSRIEAQQAAVKDVKSGEALGRAHENYDKIVEYILHPTEPRVIAVLDWELSTIGHPLMDLVYLLSPFFEDYPKVGYAESSRSGSPYNTQSRKESGIPEPQELLDRYAQIVGFDLRKDGGGKDWDTAVIFHYIRGGTISHGIQARTINGQASSKFSHIYFGQTKAMLDAAFERVKKLESEAVGGPKL